LSTDDITSIRESIQKLELYIEEHDYKGYDPFDGLASCMRPLAFRNMLAERILQQTIRQCPVNLRPLLGVKPEDSPIGRGYMVSGYLKMFEITGEKKYLGKAIDSLGWLMKNKSPGYTKYCWGNHFDYVSRTGSLPKFEPTIVWTSLIGQSFLDAYTTISNDEYLRTAISICDWVLELPREKTDEGICLSYIAKDQSSIHNSNMLGAAILARTAKIIDNDKYFQVAKDAMEYSCSRQLPNGAWYYGDAANLHWIDNFHTGYNLESLRCYIDNTGDKTYERNFQHGLSFFCTTFFEENGRPKYYHHRAYPIDIQCVAQAIEVLANCSKDNDSSLRLAANVARWAIENMQDKYGYFYYRLYPFNVKAKTSMIHWGQTTMYKALAVLLSKHD